MLPEPRPEPAQRPAPSGAELGACSSTPSARERTQERRRPAPAPRAAGPPLRTLELLPPPPKQPIGVGDQSLGFREKSQRGNPDWTLLDPQERLAPLPFYLACPPRTGQLPEALGGVRTVVVPTPQHAGQDGSQLMCVASFSLLQAHKEPPGL